jgi:hypothetical protein
VCKWTEGSKIQLDGLKTGVVCSWVLGHTSQFVITLCTLQIVGGEKKTPPTNDSSRALGSSGCMFGGGMLILRLVGHRVVPNTGNCRMGQ